MDSVVDSISAWHASGPGSIPGYGSQSIFGVKTLVLNTVGPVSIWDVNEPVRMTSALTVTTLRANIERSSWRKCYEKN